MLRLEPRSKVLLILLCIAVVALRVSGAHLHLCLDGSEPPVAVHIDHDMGMDHLDDGHAAARAEAHSDMDVNLIADALVKKSDSRFELLNFFAAFTLLLCLLTLGRSRAFFLRSQASPFVTRAFLRPPLRGPPR